MALGVEWKTREFTHRNLLGLWLFLTYGWWPLGLQETNDTNPPEQ